MNTIKHIKDQLKNLHAPQNSVVLMHTSLRSIGEVEGGAMALLDALIEYFTAQGGLFCVPTHTWDNLFKDKITLDLSAPESNLGAFSTVAVNDNRGVRSLNPTHSMVVFGDRDKAIDFIKDDEYIDSPTSPDSCYGKLFTMSGYVLLVGVAQDKNTYLHTVAEILNIPNRMTKDKTVEATVRDLNGEISKRRLRFFDCSFSEDISLLFPKYDTAFRYHRAIKDGFIGNAPCQLCDAVKLKDTIELIFQNSGGKDPLEYIEPIPQKWYCNK